MKRGYPGLMASYLRTIDPCPDLLISFGSSEKGKNFLLYDRSDGSWQCQREEAVFTEKV